MSTALLHDRDIREPLFLFLEETFGKIRIIEEKNMGRSRADVIMVTEGAITGIEIKSDADTYARLSRQIKDYDLFCDYNYVAVGSRHAMHIEEHIPAHWGIITVDDVDGQPDFYILRRASVNPFMDREKKIRILWRPELAAIQTRHNMPAYKNYSKLNVEKKILEKIPWDELTIDISEALFERDYNAIADIINEYRLQNGQKKKRRTHRVRRRRGKASM